MEADLRGFLETYLADSPGGTREEEPLDEIPSFHLMALSADPETVARETRLARPEVRATNAAEGVLSNAVQEIAIQQQLDKVEQAPLREMVQLLLRLIEQRGGAYAEGFLDLGIVYAELGEADKAVAALDEAIDQAAARPIPDAHYHLGRVRFQQGSDLSGAVSALQQALALLPEGNGAGHPARSKVQYFLGQAIRALVERQILGEAEQALRAYLAAGAPLGHDEAIRAFLRARQGEARG